LGHVLNPTKKLLSTRLTTIFTLRVIGKPRLVPLPIAVLNANPSQITC